MPGLRIPCFFFDAFPARSARPSRQKPIDIVAVACAILTIGGLVAYAAALALLARGMM